MVTVGFAGDELTVLANKHDASLEDETVTLSLVIALVPEASIISSIPVLIRKVVVAPPIANSKAFKGQLPVVVAFEAS